MEQHIEVTAAYGRSYGTLAAMKADWMAGLDFRLTTTGQYLSRRDATDHNLGVVGRYGPGNTKVGTLRRRGGR